MLNDMSPANALGAGQDHGMTFVDPCYIAWEIISACNLGCRFCYSSSWNYQRDGVNGEGERVPSVSFIKEKLELLKKAFPSLEYINWTGGEPLMRHKDLGEILEFSKQLGLKNILSTNAYFSKAGLSKKEFLDLLDSWSENLDVLSVSLDSSDLEINNGIMRVLSNGRFDSTDRSEHLQDVDVILNAFENRLFPFALKINTMVTAKNHASLTKMVERLANISCIWHLIEFNPRQCPEDSIEEFELEGGEDSFEKIVMRINQECERQESICKFTITTRVYDGIDRPYWFLVLNTKGQVLLPIGKDHCVTATIKDGTVDPMELRKIVTNSIYDAVFTRNSTYKLVTDTTAAFNDGNKKILARYLHHTASAVRAAFVLPWLREMLSEALSFPTEKVDMLGMFVEGVYDMNGKYCAPPIKELARKYLRQQADENEDLTHIGALLLEQPRVGRFLSISYGVLGGTLVLLPKNMGGKRLSPAIEQEPPGLHMPWCFPTRAKKQEFFRRCFQGVIPTPESDAYFVSAGFIIKPCLTQEVLDKVVKQSIVDSQHTNITERIKSYLSESPEDGDKDEELVLWIILSRCIEATLGKISSFSLDDKADPWIKHFIGSTRSPSHSTDPETAKQSVIAYLQKLKQDSHTLDEQIEKYWTPSEKASSSDVDTVVASIWIFLYEPLRKLDYQVPYTFAFRVGSGSDHVAIGALYIVEEPSLEPLTDPIRAKRRLGALLETLATPTFTNQLQRLQEQKVEDELMRKEILETKKTQDNIKEDITKLLQVSWDISRAASNIAEQIKIATYEHVAKQISIFFPKKETSYVIDSDTGFARNKQGSEAIGNEFILTTAHDSTRVTQVIWSNYTKMLTSYSKALHQPWLEQIAGVPYSIDNKIIGQKAFDLLKTITYRADTAKNKLHAIQLIFALRNASAEVGIPVILKIEANHYQFNIKDKRPDYVCWLIDTYEADINDKDMYCGDAQIAYTLPSGITSIATTDALTNLVNSLLPKGATHNTGHVALTSAEVSVKSSGVEMRVLLECSGRFSIDKDANPGSLTDAFCILGQASGRPSVMLNEWFTPGEGNASSVEILFPFSLLG